MGLLAPLAALLGLEVEELATRAKTTALIYGLIALCLMVAAGFLLAAGYMALAEVVGSILAALIIAAAFVLLALAAYLGSMIGRGRRQRKVAERRRASETGAFLTTAAITALPFLARSPMLVRLGLPAAAIAALAMIRDNKNRD